MMGQEGLAMRQYRQHCMRMREGRVPLSPFNSTGL